MHCSNMITELGFGKEFEQVPLHIDNTATLHVIGNRAFSSRTKDITLRFFYLRELVKNKMITTHYISTERQVADNGTKHLNEHRLEQLLQMIKSFKHHRRHHWCFVFFCLLLCGSISVSEDNICFVLY